MVAPSHMDGEGEIMPTFGRKPQFLTTWTSPQGCLHVLMTRQLASPRMNDSRERLKPQGLL